MTSPIFKIYSRAVISDDENKILMVQKKPDQKIAGGLWILPGGTLEFGETPETGLIRELSEEIFFTPTELQLIGVDTRIIGNTHWLGIFFKAMGDVKSIKNNEPDKHQAIQWCNSDFLRAHLSAKEASFVMNSHSDS